MNRLVALTISGLLVSVLAGCSNSGASSNAELTVTSSSRRCTFRQDFTRAYASREAGGNMDVVLVDRATERSLRGEDVQTPVHEVMHIRVLWEPSREMKAVVSNAAIKWYVISRNHPEDVLEYTGTGFVSVESDGDGGFDLKIHTAALEPSKAPASLVDPVGPSRIQGTFNARRDDKAVRQVLSDVRTSVALGALPKATEASITDR